MQYVSSFKPVDPMVADVVGKLKLDTVPEVPVKYWRHPSGPVERKNIKKIFFSIAVTVLVSNQK